MADQSPLDLFKQALTGAWLTRPRWGPSAETALILLGGAMIALAAPEFRDGLTAEARRQGLI